MSIKNNWKEFKRIMAGMWEKDHPYQSVARIAIAILTATIMSLAGHRNNRHKK